MKLLIDECLSEELAKLARSRGHIESSHVRWIGKGGAKDWELLPVVLDGDWTFVTRNAIDFRGPSDARGTRGEYRKAALHAGLVCLNGPVGMDLEMQLDLLGVALDALGKDGELINQVLEITLGGATEAEISVLRYEYTSMK
jgi:hypothetical protein